MTGFRVAVIGAGGGGIAMGCALARAGLDFTIFESSAGVGGTWFDNTYPGCEVDTAQPLYSFSFSPANFSRTHVRQPELLSYLELTAERYGLRSHLRLRTQVTKAVWDESAHTYTVQVRTADGEPQWLAERYNVVVSAVGLLNVPNYPTWPGLERFTGRAFHSQYWPRDLDLVGQRVAVVGTGSTSVQITAAIAPLVEQLYVFQRQPGWLLPKGDRDFTPRERSQLLNPLYRRYVRAKQWIGYDRARMSNIEGSQANQRLERTARDYIEHVFAERPDLKKLVTPDYPYGGKRTLRDSNFYPALLRENVELVPWAVRELTERGVVDATGLEREVDVVVMCTGFKPSAFLARLDLVGRDGRSVHDVWQGDAQAFLGLTVHGFPNFYMLYGPNTNGGAPIFWMHERQIAFVMANIRRMRRSGVTAIEVRKSVVERYNAILQHRLARQVVAEYGRVHNYSRAESGRNVLGWGEGLTVYGLLAKSSPRLSSRARRRAGGVTN